MNTPRRSILGGLLGALFGAACSSAPVKPPPPPLGPLATDKLEGLATSAGLSWMVRAKPRAIAQIPWLIPSIGKIVPEPHFDKFRERSGLDPRQLHEVYLLKYGEALANAEAQIVRHNGDGVMLEKKFFARLTSDAVRTEDRPDLVRLSGNIGRSNHAFARIGKDIVAYQQRGEDAKGPVAIASLFARGKMPKVRRLLADDPLKSLVARFGEAPLVAAALGPFTDEWKSAAGGLLEVSDAIAGAARPTARENIGVAIAIVGNFSNDDAKAAEVLKSAWDAIAVSTMGRLLGLDRPIEPALTAGDRGVITLSVELDQNRLADGLKALVEQDLEAIMRLD